MNRVIYFDNAATSYPKPPSVVQACQDFFLKAGGNPGRSGHRLSLQSARIVFQAREALAAFFGAADSSRLIFTSNATEALNLAILGTLREGDHVVTSSMEHNAVMRPLRHLERARSVEITVVRSNPDGTLDPAAVAGALRDNTALIVLNHSSNVVGTLLPVREVAALKGSVPLLVDAAQTAGVMPIDVQRDGIDFLAFTGHKSLWGPTGTGGLFIRPGLQPLPLRFGGTGSLSEKEEMPDFLPDLYESGTLNMTGIAGLLAGLKEVERAGLPAIREHEILLTGKLLEGLKTIDGATIYGTCDPERQTATVSFNIEGLASSDITGELDRRFNIMTRSGLQCAPAAHRTIGTHPAGTVRVSMGWFNTVQEVECLIESLAEITRSMRRG
jgi:cysteine desulfurase family protein